MENLSKQQLVLLALLVSFVTSIATGIVTVSLIDQAPPEVTQTINRVVEKTIERVVTEPSRQQAAVVTKETVVVKADDLVIAAIEKNTVSVVRIREIIGEGENRTERLAGLGLIVRQDGLIAADISIAHRSLNESGEPIPESYRGVFPSGEVFSLDIVANEQDPGIIFFKALASKDAEKSFDFTVPIFSSGKLKLGQAVVALGGEESDSVSTGIIANLVTRSVKENKEATTTAEKLVEKELVAIKTDIRSTELLSGSMLLNLSGEVIGISAGAVAIQRNTFLPIARVTAVLPK